MDREKVIKGLVICSEHGSWHGLDCEHNEAYKDCPYRGCETGCVVTIAKDAIALLKEQNAVKAQKKNDDEPIPWTSSWYVCGDCGQEIDYHDRFCRWCGKAVKWDD